jgi:hypothetical protein
MAAMVFRLQHLVVACLVVCGFAATHADETGKKSALDLLDGAVNLAQQLNLQDRDDTILAASDVAATLDASRANGLAREAFDLTRRMPEVQYRVSRQKNALRVLAVNDPDMALGLYRQQDVVKPSEDPEDPRALSVPSIFSVVWAAKGRSYLNQLTTLAVYLGETGQYPYRPMADIALDLAKTDGKRAQHVLADATRAFRHDPGFASSNLEFVEFTTKTGGIASRSVLRRELRAAVSLQRQRPNLLSQAKFRIGVTTPIGNAEFDSESEYLLFRLLPWARAADPRLAERLLETHPLLRSAPTIGVNTPVQTAGAASAMGTDSEERMRFTLDRSRVFHVSQLAKDDPAQARALAEQIGNPDLRIMAFALLAPVYVELDPRQAQAWVDDAERNLASIKDDKTKLGLMTVLVKAYDVMRKEQAARARLTTAFALGEKVYSEDRRQHPDRPTYAAQAFDALQQLAYESARLEGALEAKARISQVTDMALRVSLLISAARALASMPPDPFLPA